MASLLLLLTAAGLASAHASRRLQFAWRVERLLGALLLFHVQLFVVTYLAGATTTFTRGETTIYWVVSSLALFAVGGARREAINDTVDALRTWASYVPRALYEQLRARSLLLVPLCVALVLFVYLGVQSALLPVIPYWDTLWYHEPQVGLTIQAHGFSPLDLPSEPGAQKANGYPRFAEAQSALYALHTGRALLELPNFTTWALLLVATYVLVRRWTHNRSLPLAAVAMTATTPTVAQHVPTLCNDVPLAAFLVALACMAYRPRLTVGVAALAAAACTMALSTKWIGYFIAPTIIAMLFGRLLLWKHQLGTSRWLAALGVGAAMPLVLSLLWPLRNWRAFGNPLWPDLAVNVPALGIDWPGAVKFGRIAEQQRQDQLQLNLPWKDLFADATRLPWSWQRWHYHEVTDYGMAALFVVFPLLPVAVIALSASEWRGRSRVQAGALWSVAPLLVWVMATPARWASRYHIALIVMGCALVAHAFSSLARKYSEQLVGALAITSIFSVLWCHRYWVRPAELARASKLSWLARERLAPDAFDQAAGNGVGPMGFGTRVVPELAARRDEERPTIATTGESGTFWGTFWDSRFRNRVVYVPFGADYGQRLQDACAQWAYCSNGQPCASFFREHPAEWEPLGAWYRENANGIMYHRVSR